MYSIVVHAEQKRFPEQISPDRAELEQNPGVSISQPTLLFKNLFAFGLNVLLSFSSVSEWSKECNKIVIQPMTVIPHFSLGKYSRCLFPSFGNPWSLSADKLLHTSKKARRRGKDVLVKWSSARRDSAPRRPLAMSGDT